MAALSSVPWLLACARLLLLAGSVLSLACAQSSVTLTAAQDTTLYDDPNGALANGAGPALFLGTAGGSSGGAARRALVRFELAGAIPAGARILDARLSLFVEQTSATQPRLATAHRVLAPWLEGSVVAPGNGGGGGPALPGESTWLFRDYPNVPWINPGGDFEPAPSFAFELPIAGAVESSPEVGLIADLESWRADPSSNFGWLLKTDESGPGTARRCSSRQAAANPPRLQIFYLMPGRALAFGAGCPPVQPNSALGFGLGISVGPFSPGGSVSLFYVNGPSSSPGATFVSLHHDPVGLPLFPGCRLYMRDPILMVGLFTTDASGTAAASLTMPVGSPGYLVAVQAAALDSGPAGFTFTSGGVLVTP